MVGEQRIGGTKYDIAPKKADDKPLHDFARKMTRDKDDSAAEDRSFRL